MLDQILMELPNPMIHAGTANFDNDCLYYGQAMKANDHDDFRKAMSIKLKVHIDQRNWVKLPHTTLPKDMNPSRQSGKPACAFTVACKKKESTSGKPIRPLSDGLPYNSC
jgi:hypothetical protein